MGATGNRLQSSARKLRDWRSYVAIGNFDIWLFVLIMALLAVGLVMMFSASYVNAASYKKSNFDPFYYIKKQLLFAVLGVVFMLMISRIKYTVWRGFALPVLIIAVGLLVLVLIAPSDTENKEEFKRWIEIAGIRFQPSELAKFALILFLSKSMEKYNKALNSDWKMMLPYLLLIGAVCFLVYKEHHLSGTILMLGIGVLMTYLGGGKIGWFILALIAAGTAALILIKNPHILDAYAGDRITAWLDKDYDPQGARYQTNQSLYAIGSGGLFGLGLGNSKQKHLYMPEPQNDFIFAIVCEELGFIGAVVIILLFAMLICRGFIVGIKARDKFGALLSMGVMLQVGLQTVLNIMVVTDMMPNTGIGLPFFSSGGTALVVLLAEMGFVLGVSRYSNVTKR